MQQIFAISRSKTRRDSLGRNLDICISMSARNQWVARGREAGVTQRLPGRAFASRTLIPIYVSILNLHPYSLATADTYSTLYNIQVFTFFFFFLFEIFEDLRSRFNARKILLDASQRRSNRANAFYCERWKKVNVKFIERSTLWRMFWRIFPKIVLTVVSTHFVEFYPKFSRENYPNIQ